MKELTNPREAAYLAILASIREERFAADYLESWRSTSAPSGQDFHFAQEITYGTVRMALALDYIGLQLTDKKKLSLKPKEKALLRSAIYQRVFMNKVPLYAIVNETVSLAKRYCHSTFVSFLNALLRKLEGAIPPLPQGDSPRELSTRFSYPEYYVNQLIKDYGVDNAKEILQIGNEAACTTVRIRKKGPVEGVEMITEAPCRVGKIKDSALLPSLATSSDFYIQNTTPATLIGNFCQQLQQRGRVPKRILDLCAAPGGKLLAVHDFFQDAKLYANDISEAKLRLIAENLHKYQVKAELSCSRGEDYVSDEPFDLIILDVPCSNTGVLNKRAEARWRLSEKAVKELEEIQLLLIKRAQSLLAPGGKILYITCSILKGENEALMEKACSQLGLLSGEHQQCILPSREGWDGGFASSLRNTT